MLDSLTIENIASKQHLNHLIEQSEWTLKVIN